jgi:hypothetical protein
VAPPRLLLPCRCCCCCFSSCSWRRPILSVISALTSETVNERGTRACSDDFALKRIMVNNQKMHNTHRKTQKSSQIRARLVIKGPFCCISCRRQKIQKVRLNTISYTAKVAKRKQLRRNKKKVPNLPLLPKLNPGGQKRRTSYYLKERMNEDANQNQLLKLCSNYTVLRHQHHDENKITTTL